MVRRGLDRACLTKSIDDWFIALHDVYGQKVFETFAQKLNEDLRPQGQKVDSEELTLGPAPEDPLTTVED